MTISIPTARTTIDAIAAANPTATVTMTAGRITVLVGAVEFVAQVHEPLTSFPHGYLSRRSA